jgi:hypothetical protein
VARCGHRTPRGASVRQGHTGGVKLSRRWSLFLLAFAVWSWIIWPTFLKNIANDPRAFVGNTPQGFFWVHLVLVVVSLALGTLIGVLGVRGLLAARRPAAVTAAADQERQAAGRS